MSSPRVLHLTVKEEWFNKIVVGIKTVEYREYKPYWITRLEGKQFDEVHFRNGYSRNAPCIRCKCLGIDVIEGENDLGLSGPVFAIKLGRKV